MKPHRTPTTTAVLGEPPDWDEDAYGVCEGLPVTSDGGVLYSFWRPSWRELIALLFGRSVRLGVVGIGHPPVSLDTQQMRTAT